MGIVRSPAGRPAQPQTESMNPTQAMKQIQVFVLLLLATLFTGTSSARDTVFGPTQAATATATVSATEQTRKALEKFYTEYARWMAASFDEEIAEPASPLDDATRRKVEKAREESGGDPIIRAQDFNQRSLRTISVEHVEGEWYAVAYLDTYENHCVVIPFRALLRKGQLVITDVVLP